ncbi:MAG: asparagine synthase (glutamine-hydrolyzing) [Candidatus Bathyarchaeia archaeon]|jgi:asparagine synthase (glutamine-hydrolysing)
MGAGVAMCGIAGELRFDQSASSLAITKTMCDAQIHRGPDDEGYYSSGPISLGIRRLAIIDLRKGLYPISNEQGTIRLVFNGEIYGFEALRKQLERLGHRFRSDTDAETVVHSYEEWGTGCLEKLNGMFAFALWDEPKQLLWIARDHFGIKPLYYCQSEKFFAFASEIKPLLRHPGLSWIPNERLIRQYLNSGVTADGTESTFFDGIGQLAPSQHLSIQPDGVVKRERYWQPRVSRELDGRTSNDEIEQTRRLFLDGIALHLVSDVPVGTCLSGGVDSSSVVCAIKKVHPNGAVSTGQRIKAFSAVFPGDPIDELQFSKNVCDHTGSEHSFVTPTAEEFWDDLVTLVRCQEEPFISTSVYAQWRVMKLAKERGVTVMLDGQGGDELLAGYWPYYISYLLNLAGHGKFSEALVEGIRSYDLTSSLVRTYLRSLVLDSVSRLRFLIQKRSGDSTLGNSPTLSYLSRAPVGDLAARLEMDATTTSLPALLRYEDKNSMWHSIEARVPFLHRPFFEYVASLPLDRKLHNGWTKYIFRLAMRNILPDEILLRRSKIGFETPEKRWIQELGARLNDFFSDHNLAVIKYFEPEVLRRLVSKPTLTNDEARLIWRILNVELWYREFVPQQSRRIENSSRSTIA